MAVVMFYGKEPQYVLSDIERDASGTIRKAEVVNGAWTLRVTDTEHQALAGRHIKNRWPKPSDVREVIVPNGGDYNDIIARAVEHDNMVS
jgi:hypothetical protein